MRFNADAVQVSIVTIVKDTNWNKLCRSSFQENPISLLECVFYFLQIPEMWSTKLDLMTFTFMFTTYNGVFYNILLKVETRL